VPAGGLSQSLVDGRSSWGAPLGVIVWAHSATNLWDEHLEPKLRIFCQHPVSNRYYRRQDRRGVPLAPNRWSWCLRRWWCRDAGAARKVECPRGHVLIDPCVVFRQAICQSDLFSLSKQQNQNEQLNWQAVGSRNGSIKWINCHPPPCPRPRPRPGQIIIAKSLGPMAIEWDCVTVTEQRAGARIHCRKTTKTKERNKKREIFLFFIFPKKQTTHHRDSSDQSLAAPRRVHRTQLTTLD